MMKGRGGEESVSGGGNWEGGVKGSTENGAREGEVESKEGTSET